MKHLLHSSPHMIAKRIRRSSILSGALLLTAAGMLTRIIGFFYRIFLSRTFGAENIGIYQLIAPVMALSYSLAVAGFQTAISKITATACAAADNPVNKSAQPGFFSGKNALAQVRSFSVLAAGILLSLALSSGIACFVYINAEEIAVRFLLESRTAPLLKILALSFPVSSIHGCASGFFLGRKAAGFPAFSQLLEQIIRVFTVLFLCRPYLFSSLESRSASVPDISLAVVGMVVGEAGSALLSIFYILYCYQKEQRTLKNISAFRQNVFSSKEPFLPKLFSELLILALPLSAGRVIQNFLQSVEAIAIPDRLRMFGLDSASALSEYGILTGMSLPFILFPTALTGSIALMLLPAVSEAQALHQERTISRAVHRSTHYCLLLGFACLLFFFFFGPTLGRFVFHEEQAGNYLRILGFMCPFLYVNSTLASILHGLGKTIRSFFYSAASLLMRLFFVFFCIPVVGIKGYLWALLASQLLLSVLQLFALRKYLTNNTA